MCSEKEMKTKLFPKSESSLSNSCKSKTVFLQTLCVIIRCQGQEKLIRAVIDSGSQSTYVSENVITHLKALPLRSKTVIHALFGAAVAEWYRYRIVACLVTSSSPVPLKTCRVGQRCTLNLSRAETSSRWCGVVVRRGGASSGVIHVT
ncbi:uncharacterized protein TNCV_5036071 [Trichonephila clavipes]|nr:uncharacterized protein TNCV_5036071 [Trichonephila clavipes]